MKERTQMKRKCRRRRGTEEEEEARGRRRRARLTAAGERPAGSYAREEERVRKKKERGQECPSVDGVGSSGRRTDFWQRLAYEWQTCGWLFLQAGREEAVVAMPVALAEGNSGLQVPIAATGRRRSERERKGAGAC